jgi:glutathione-regulated potassium-efflux system ancillary protein KefG
MHTFEGTLFLVSHPALSKSNIHTAFVGYVQAHGGTVRHLDSVIDAEFHFDIPAEQAILESFSSIVLQFPMYWYATPAVMKQYFDEVLTSGWAYEGRQALAGKHLSAIITMGGDENSYAHAGSNSYSQAELSAPYRATAAFCGMKWGTPLFIYDASQANPEKVEQSLSELANWRP